MTKQANAIYSAGNANDHRYKLFLDQFNDNFEGMTAGGEPLFTTDAERLWEAYLSVFVDTVEKQYHNCHSCRYFIDRFAGLVVIDSDGRTSPAFLSQCGDIDLDPALEAMAKIVRRAKVTGVFHSSAAVLGQPLTGSAWAHISAVLPPSMVYKATKVMTASQAMAESREDHKNLSVALSEYSSAAVAEALRVLSADVLYRSEKVLGQAQFLAVVHSVRDAAKASKTNAVWRAVAKAPKGFLHPRSSMIGTLLDDIVSGMDFEQVSRRFAEKMHPLRYQRPQAAPAAGNIAEAEKLVERLGIARSIERRFARIDEIKTIWKPRDVASEKPATGVFSHLRPKGKTGAEIKTMDLPAQTITFAKFVSTVLPVADAIDILIPHGLSNFGALVTAVHADSPPILQWDRDEQRNPVSWYTWDGGVDALQYGLTPARYAPLSAIALRPSMWHEPDAFAHHGTGAIFIIAGARETRAAGSALFPETLKSELRPVRSVIEAHSRSVNLQGMEEASACGLLMQKHSDYTVRVWTSGSNQSYQIDRWD